MQSGKLRQRITFQTRADTLDDRGQRTGAYEDGESAWAKVETLSGNELEIARKLFANVTHRIEIRYRSGLTTKHRLTWRGRTLHIGAVIDPDENRRRKLWLLCQEAA